MKKILISIFIFIFSISNVYALDISKTASNLDSNYKTNIKLKIEAGEVSNKKLDVVFVVDASTVRNTELITETYNFIDNINKDDSIDANFAIVVFGLKPITVMELTNESEITSEDYISNKIISNSEISSIVGITNIQGGLVKAKEILDNSTTGTEKEDRHVILLTDGAAFTYNNSRGETSNSLYKVSNTMYLNMGNMDSNGDVGNPSRETKTVKYYSETSDYKKAFAKLLEEDLGSYADKGYRWNNHDNNEINELISQDNVLVYSSTSQVNNIEIYPYTNLEIGTYRAAKELESMKSEEYKIHTIGYLYEYGFKDNGEISNRLLGLPPICFLSWTENVGDLYLENTKSISQAKYNEIFTDIYEGLLTSTDNPVYLIDEIGFGKYSDNTSYDLEFVNDINSIDVLEGNTKLDKEVINDNTYGFGKDSSITQGYKVILKYFPNGISGTTDNECFKVDINYVNADALEINYSELLGKKSIKTTAGTYGKYDENGSKGYDEIKANNKATLYFESGNTKEFSIPTLSYIVKNKEVKEAEEENPDTGDSVIKYFTLFTLSLGLIVIFITKREKYAE